MLKAFAQRLGSLYLYTLSFSPAFYTPSFTSNRRLSLSLFLYPILLLFIYIFTLTE